MIHSRFGSGKAAPPGIIHGHSRVRTMSNVHGSGSNLDGECSRHPGNLFLHKRIEGLCPFLDALAAAVKVVGKPNNRGAKVLAVGGDSKEVEE